MAEARVVAIGLEPPRGGGFEGKVDRCDALVLDEPAPLGRSSGTIFLAPRAGGRGGVSAWA